MTSDTWRPFDLPIITDERFKSSRTLCYVFNYTFLDVSKDRGVFIIWAKQSKKIIYRTTRRHDPEHLNLQQHHNDNVISHTYVIFGEKFCLCLQRTFWGQLVLWRCGIHLPEHKASAVHCSLSSHIAFDYMIITTHKFVVLTFLLIYNCTCTKFCLH